MQTFLGTRTAADINLVAQVLLLAGLLIGFALARKKRFREHGNVQTAMVLLNLFLIAFAMAPSFFGYVVEGGTTTGTVATLMIIHGVLGTAVEVVAIYLILRMRTKLVPPRFRVRNIKLVMRTTLVMWTVLVLLGLGVYGERYLVRDTETSAPLLQMRQLSADLYVHAVELDDAAARSSLAAVKRHAEHIINITEGSGGPDYGDADANGRLEDPGDGIGLRARIDAVLAVTPDQAAEAAAMRASLDRMVALSLTVVGADDVTAATAPVTEILGLARQTNSEGVLRLDLAARAAGVAEEPLSLGVAAGSAPPGSTTIHELSVKFRPLVLTIPVGSTVEWVDDDRPKHTVTADDGTFDSTTMTQGDTFSHTFAEPGTWRYYCRFHGDVGGVGMYGTIIVQ